MGNVHGVVGLEPCLSVEGALLPVRGGQEPAFLTAARSLQAPSYVEIERQTPSLTIYNPNVFSSRVPDRSRAATYLVVEGGGKWGYDAELRDYVEALAPYLEDATFLLGDEYQGYVDRWRIYQGRLEVERLVESGGEVADHARELLVDRPEALAELCRQEAEQWLANDEAEEALPFVERGLTLRPGSAELLGQRGCCLTALGREDEALACLREAIAALPPHELRAWGSDGQLLMVPDGVPLGREIASTLKTLHARIAYALVRLERYEEACEHYARSHAITPTLGRVDGLDGLCVTLLQLHRLDEAEARIAELLQRAPSRGAIARAYYHRACLHARRGRADEAVRDASVVLELRPAWRGLLAADDDLASLRERDDFTSLVAEPSAPPS